MSNDFNVNHISYRFFGDKLTSLDLSNNLIMEASDNNIELKTANKTISFNNNTIFNYGLALKNNDLSNIINITGKILNIDTLFVTDIVNSQANIDDYGYINNGYIRATTIGYNPAITNSIIGSSIAYFTYIDVSGGDSSFNNSVYIKNSLDVSGATTISNDLIVNGTSYVTLYNAISNYISNIKEELSSNKILTLDLSATNISVSNELVVNKTSFLNNISISGHLLDSVLKVPHDFTIDPSGHDNASGTLIINGDLIVYGNKTTINSNIVEISDITLSVATNLMNANDLYNNQAGLDISNVASIKYDGTNWNFNGGQLTVENKKVSLDVSLIALKTSSITSLNSLNNYFDVSYIQLVNNNDNSYNATYSRTQIDASFLLKSDFDISYNSFRTYLDNSYVKTTTFDASFSSLKTYLDASYILKSTSTIINSIDLSLNFLRNKIDLSYVLKSTFESSYNSLKEQIEISFGSIRLTSLDTSSISVETINTKHFTQRFNNILWNQIGLDISNGPPLINNNKKVAISNDGKVVALSSSSHSDVSKGRVYVYELSYNQASYNWRQLGLSSEILVGVSNDDQFGWDIALSSNGRVVAASSINSDASGINCGQVRLFELSNNNVWRQKGLNINGPRAASESGYSISLAGNGNSIAIGAWKDNSNGTNAGAVRVYDFSSNIADWRQRGQTIAGVSGSFEGYTTALSSDGQTLASASILEASRNIISFGSTLLTIGEYIIHSFTNVGTSTFRPSFSGSVEVLIVGGGGGGGSNIGGGGGGGAVIWIPATNVSADTNYSIVVGDGGASGTNGQNSSAFTAIAAGGGTSGSWPSGSGTAGGSGGGAAANNDNINQGGGVSNVSTLGTNSGFIYGCSGGNMTTARLDNATNGYSTRGAGGGGAGPNGTGKALDTNSNIFGDTGQTGMGSGGLGYSSAILGTSYYWAGGGGGGAYTYGVSSVGGYGGWGGGGGGASYQGTGGPGGGFALNNGSPGANGSNTTGGAGGANTGGGGGGGSHVTGPGGKGGSGIVVIRYLASNVTTKEQVKTFTWSGTSWINKGIIQGPQIYLLDSSYNGSTTKLGQSIGKSFSYFNTQNNVTYTVDPQYQHISLNGDGTIFGAGIYDQNSAGVVRINRYNTLDNSWSSLGQLIQGNDNFARNINLSTSGYRFSVGALSGGEYAIWIYNYNFSTSLWDKIGDISMATVVSSSRINALSGDGNTIAIANEHDSSTGINQAGKIRIFRYQGTGTTWTKIGQDICGTFIARSFGQSIKLSSDGNILAAGTRTYPAPGGYQGIVKVYIFNGNTWTQIGELLGPGFDVNTWKEMGFNRLGISSNGLTIASGFYGGINIYKYVSDMNWSLTPIYPDPNGSQSNMYPVFLSDDGNTLATGSGREVIIYKFRQSKWIKIIYFFNDPIYNITLSHDGTTYAFSSRNNVVEGGAYVVVNKINTSYTGQYYQDLSYNTNKDKYLTLFFGRDVKLSSTGNKIVVGATGPIRFTLDNSANIYNDTIYRYNQGSVWAYGYVGGTTWTQLGQAIQGISGGDEFGSSVSMSNDGTIIAIGSDNNSNNRGHVRVFSYANNYWYQVSNAIDGKTASSRAGIHALSGDGTTLIQSNNTYNSVYGINKTLTLNAPMTSISGNLLVMGNISVNSLDISTNHSYATNGYSYKMFGSDLSSAIMKEYYSDVISTRHLKVQITGNGYITNRNNSYRALSDSRLKENIQDSGPKLEDLLKVRVVNYTMKGSNNTKYIGVLAQELEELFPNLVTELEPSPKDIQDGNTIKYKAVNYSSFDAILIKSLQQQNAMLKNIEKRIIALEDELDDN